MESTSKPICVPQRPQKQRRAPGEETWIAGSPAVTAFASRGSIAHATPGAPAARRHIEQWQHTNSSGSPRSS